MTPGPAGQAGSPAPGLAASRVISGDLFGVATVSARDLWAVGSTDASDPMTVHWNGSAWTAKALPLGNGQPGDPPGGFNAVAALSAHDVWAAGVNAGEPPGGALEWPRLGQGTQPAPGWRRHANRRDISVPRRGVGSRYRHPARGEACASRGHRALGRPDVDARAQPGRPLPGRRDRRLTRERLACRICLGRQRSHCRDRALGRQSLDLSSAMDVSQAR